MPHFTTWILEITKSWLHGYMYLSGTSYAVIQNFNATSKFADILYQQISQIPVKQMVKSFLNLSPKLQHSNFAVALISNCKTFWLQNNQTVIFSLRQCPHCHCKSYLCTYSCSQSVCQTTIIVRLEWEEGVHYTLNDRGESLLTFRCQLEKKQNHFNNRKFNHLMEVKHLRFSVV